MPCIVLCYAWLLQGAMLCSTHHLSPANTDRPLHTVPIRAPQYSHCWLCPLGWHCCRPVLETLQGTGVLELQRQQQPADGSSQGNAQQATWQLLPAGIGLGLTEASLEAAGEAEGAVGPAFAAAAAEGGTAGQADSEAAQAGAAAAPAPTAPPTVPAAAAAPPAAPAAAPPAAPPAPLTLPISLAVRWLRGSYRPPSAALQFLRPGAAAMLHAVLVSWQGRFTHQLMAWGERGCGT